MVKSSSYQWAEKRRDLIKSWTFYRLKKSIYKFFQLFFVLNKKLTSSLPPFFQELLKKSPSLHDMLVYSEWKHFNSADWNASLAHDTIEYIRIRRCFVRCEALKWGRGESWLWTGIVRDMYLICFSPDSKIMWMKRQSLMDNFRERIQYLSVFSPFSFDIKIPLNLFNFLIRMLTSNNLFQNNSHSKSSPKFSIVVDALLWFYRTLVGTWVIYSDRRIKKNRHRTPAVNSKWLHTIETKSFFGKYLHLRLLNMAFNSISLNYL